MKRHIVTYLFYTLLIICLIVNGQSEAHAQRARKHRSGMLNSDSLRSQYAADSLALLDTLSIQRQKVEALEAPIDTAALIRQNDSIQRQVTQALPIEKKTWLPVPSKSTWLALAIPGAGQIYNRKYWKLPIIYGGFAGCAYALSWNNQMYKDYSQAYQDIMSDDTSNDSYMDFLPAGYTQATVLARLSYYQSLFQKRKNVYRRQRDLSIFVFIGVYLLSVIDAYVDAELSNFDITNDLGMKLEPTIFNDALRHRPQAVGLQCSITF